MKWQILIGGFFLMLGACPLTAQECYRIFYQEGKQAFDQLDFDGAIKQFQAAKICDDLPLDNDIDQWINKAQNGYINAIKAEQTKSQSLALTAKSIIELLKKENATKAFRYAQEALKKEETVEARGALYESFYQLENEGRKNFYIRELKPFAKRDNTIRNTGFLDHGRVIFVFGEINNTLKLFNFDGALIANLTTSVHWFDEQAYSKATGTLLTTEKNDGRQQLVARKLADAKLQEKVLFTYPSPAGDIDAASISPDGSTIIVSFNNGETHVLDGQGKLRYQLPEEAQGTNQINFSRGSRVAVSVGRKLKVFDLDKGHYQVLLDTIEKGMYNSKIRISPQGNFVMNGYGRRLSLWNVNDQTKWYPTNSLSFQSGMGNFSEDEEYMVYGQGVFNLEDTVKVNDFTYEIRQLVLSPDMRYLVANIGTNKARVYRWRNSWYDPKPLAILGGHKDFIRQIAFSPDSTHVLTASVDNVIKIWNLRMKAADRFYNAGKCWGAYNISDSLNYVISDKDDLYIVRENGELVNSYYFNPFKMIALSADARYFVNNLEEGFEIYQMDLANKNLSFVSSISNSDSLRLASFLSDSLLVCYRNANSTYSLQVWNFKSGGYQHLSGYRTDLIALSCAPDQRHVAALDDDGIAHLWKVPEEGPTELIRSWTPHPDYGASNIVFSKQGSYLITTGYDNNANVWSEDGELIVRLTDHLEKVYLADTSPDESYILTGSADGTVKIWTRQGELVTTLSGYSYSIQSAHFSDTGSHVVVNYTDGTILVWPFEPAVIFQKIDPYRLPTLEPQEQMK